MGFRPRRGGRMVRFGLVLSFCLLIGLPASACSVPVFRYALERWQPSRYELIVFHRGPLSPSDQEALKRVEASTSRSNLRVSDADLDGQLDPRRQELWNR